MDHSVVFYVTTLSKTCPPGGHPLCRPHTPTTRHFYVTTLSKTRPPGGHLLCMPLTVPDQEAVQPRKWSTSRLGYVEYMKTDGFFCKYIGVNLINMFPEI